jgi:hypothetical protein
MTSVTFSTVAAAKPEKTPITAGQVTPSTKRSVTTKARRETKTKTTRDKTTAGPIPKGRVMKCHHRQDEYRNERDSRARSEIVTA